MFFSSKTLGCLIAVLVSRVAFADQPLSFDARLAALEEQVRALKAEHESPAVALEPHEAFTWGDFGWLNGTNRQHRRVLDSQYVTGQIDIDVNYTASLWHPKDDTVVGSTALARNNEFQVAFLGLGGDFHVGNARGRMMLQFGTRTTVVPRNDGSTLRGQFDLATAYRYISEGYVGYHFNVLYGLNVDVGLFMSYVGLLSYDNFENWSYQPSFTSDNTPWFFNGARVQVFPTDRLKLELWVINGWQTYAKFNNLPGVGVQALYRPREWLSLMTSDYIGTDTANQPGRGRFHSDNSVLVRYLNAPGHLLNRAAFSVTFDLGFENGGGVTPFGGAAGPAQNFVSGMVYNRLWFLDDLFGFTIGGGFMHNPGRYLVLVPTGVAGEQFSTAPGTSFDGWDVSTTVDWMPAEQVTFRLEFVHRESNVPYFAGPGGVTSPDGYTTTDATGFQPDLRRFESRFIMACLFRL